MYRLALLLLGILVAAPVMAAPAPLHLPLRLPRTLEGRALLLAVAVSPDGRTVASAGMDNTVRLWDVASGKETATLRGHAGSVWSVAFRPDGRAVASGGRNGAVVLWDVPTGREKATLQVEGDVRSIAFSPDGTFLVVACGKSIRLRRVER